MNRATGNQVKTCERSIMTVMKKLIGVVDDF